MELSLLPHDWDMYNREDRDYFLRNYWNGVATHDEALGVVPRGQHPANRPESGQWWPVYTGKIADAMEQKSLKLFSKSPGYTERVVEKHNRAKELEDLWNATDWNEELRLQEGEDDNINWLEEARLMED